jgi:hypothetical protein
MADAMQLPGPPGARCTRFAHRPTGNMDSAVNAENRHRDPASPGARSLPYCHEPEARTRRPQSDALLPRAWQCAKLGTEAA